MILPSKNYQEFISYLKTKKKLGKFDQEFLSSFIETSESHLERLSAWNDYFHQAHLVLAVLFRVLLVRDNKKHFSKLPESTQRRYNEIYQYLIENLDNIETIYPTLERTSYIGLGFKNLPSE